METSDYQSDLTQKLGQGSYGHVYLGHSKKNDNIKVAVKELRNDEENILESAKKEFLVMQQACNNINIMKLLDFSSTVRFIYIVMEICELGDLAHYIQKSTTSLSHEEKLDIMMQCANGMSYLHNMEPPIIHRDLKPQNILMKEGTSGVIVKISDFGLAKVFEEKDKQYMSTEAGTPKFRAPEMFHKKDGRLQYTLAVDVFALGLVYLVLYKYDKETHNTFEPYDNPDEPFVFYGVKLLECRKKQEKFPTLFQIAQGETCFTLRIKFLIIKMLAFASDNRPPMQDVFIELQSVVSISTDQVLCECSQYRTQITEKDVTINELIKEIENLKHEKQITERDVEYLRLENQRLAEEMTIQKDEMDARVNTKEDEMMSDRLEHQRKEEELKSELKNSQMKEHELKSALTVKEDEMKSVLQASQAREEKLKFELKAKEDEMMSELESNKRKENELKSELKEIHRREAELKNTLTGKEDELKSVLESSQARVDKLKFELKSKENEMISTMRVSQSREDELKALLNEYQNRETERNSALEYEIEDSKRKENVLKTALTLSQNREDELKSELKESHSRGDKMTLLLNECQMREAELISALKAKEDEMMSELESKKRKENELKSELKEIHRREAELKNTLTEKEDELKSVLESSQARVDKLKFELKSKENEMISTMRVSQSREDELKALLNEYQNRETERNSALEAKEHEIEDSKRKENVLKTALTLSQNREDELKSELKESHSRGDKIKLNECQMREAEIISALKAKEHEMPSKIEDGQREDGLKSKQKESECKENELISKQKESDELQSELRKTEDREHELKCELEISEYIKKKLKPNLVKEVQLISNLKESECKVNELQSKLRNTEDELKHELDRSKVSENELKLQLSSKDNEIRSATEALIDKHKESLGKKETIIADIHQQLQNRAASEKELRVKVSQLKTQIEWKDMVQKKAEQGSHNYYRNLVRKGYKIERHYINLNDYCHTMKICDKKLFCTTRNSLLVYSMDGDLLSTVKFNYHGGDEARSTVAVNSHQFIVADRYTGVFLLNKHGNCVNVLFEGSFSDLHQYQGKVYGLNYGSQVVVFELQRQTWSKSHTITLKGYTDGSDGDRLCVNNNNIYTSSWNNDCLQIYNMDGVLLSTYGEYGADKRGVKAGLLWYPLLCDVDNSGTALIADCFNYRLQTCTATGEWQVITLPQEVGRPTYAVVNNEDQSIWVISNSKRLFKIKNINERCVVC